MSNPTALKGQSPEGPEPRGYALQSLRLVLGILTPIVIGLLLGYGLLTQVILKNFGLGRVQRIVEVGRHLDNAQYPEQWLVFIGNSIVRDGIDGAIVSEASGASIPAENLASSGADLNEHRIFLPKLLSRKPTAVVLAFVPSTACGRGTIALDKAYAYAHAGFVKAWPDYIDEDYLPGVGAEAYEVLLHWSRTFTFAPCCPPPSTPTCASWRARISAWSTRRIRPP